MALEHRWSKCIILEGNYIEKKEIDLTQKYVRLVFIDSPSYKQFWSVFLDFIYTFYVNPYAQSQYAFWQTIVTKSKYPYNHHFWNFTNNVYY